MSEYSWPEDGRQLGELARQAWPATVQALPVGTRVTGVVIFRQPFGVFIRIDGIPDAVGLAEVTAMPRDMALLRTAAASSAR
ncbi:hypothetical protein [Nocardia sp. NPDC051463]|uniref:hypothetical protein n=1 Tax=Nocardia sp. NPDC051463 TaxID=3154845 RepID=UPI00344DF05C